MMTDQELFNRVYEFFGRNDIKKCRNSYNDGNGGQCALGYIANITIVSCNRLDFLGKVNRPMDGFMFESAIANINDNYYGLPEIQLHQMRRLAAEYGLSVPEVKAQIPKIVAECEVA